MKAVIMAGGQGTRLRPVTGPLPKPLVPFLGRPLMEHILLLLKRCGFTRVCASLRYQAGEIQNRFGDGSALGISLEYRTEDRPLGTAGGVKNCADFCGSEDILVISGDAACDFDLAALMQRHKESGAAVTLALYRHPEPLPYGSVVTDEDGQIRAFIEKPLWSHVVTDLVNTGIYVLSPRAIAAIPIDREFDFARDLFPLLMSRGESLLGVPMDGYWCDVGTPLSYYRCCVDALEGRLQLDLPEEFRPPQTAPEDSEAVSAAAQLEFPCRDRAGLMGILSESLLSMDADYSDGLRLRGHSYQLHIAPLAARSSIRIAVDSQDAEFARSLALSARDLAAALEQELNMR